MNRKCVLRPVLGRVVVSVQAEFYVCQTPGLTVQVEKRPGLIQLIQCEPWAVLMCTKPQHSV